MLPRRRRRCRWHRCIVGVEGGDALAVVVVVCPACIPVVVVVVVKVTSRCLGCLAGLDFFGGDELGLLDDPFSVVLGYGGVAVDDFAECFEGGSLVLGEGSLGWVQGQVGVLHVGEKGFALSGSGFCGGSCAEEGCDGKAVDVHGSMISLEVDTVVVGSDVDQRFADV